MRAALAALAVLLVARAAGAGLADVVAATAHCSAAADGGSTCDFAVTVRHADEGWDHYADRWEVVAPDGRVLATRVLRHPHVGEQLFTRALHQVPIPAGITEVTVRAHDSVHGHGGAAVTVRLDR